MMWGWSDWFDWLGSGSFRSVLYTTWAILVTVGLANDLIRNFRRRRAGEGPPFVTDWSDRKVLATLATLWLTFLLLAAAGVLRFVQRDWYDAPISSDFFKVLFAAWAMHVTVSLVNDLVRNLRAWRTGERRSFLSDWLRIGAGGAG